MEEEEASVHDQVVELLNQVSFLPSEKERVSVLSKVQELILHRDESLLSTFHSNLLACQTDKNSDVRKWLVGFIEEACKKKSSLLLQFLPTIQVLLDDEAVSVVKRCVQAAAPLHRLVLIWITQATTITEEMELSWVILSGIKTKVIAMIDHNNDGVRTQVIKCLESLILLQTYSEPQSQQRDKEPVFSLDNVPLTLKLMRPRKLEDEAKELALKLINLQGSVHITSVNLMTCMSSLTILAKARPDFLLGNVVHAMEQLHGNLPPTLSKSQVNSVSKHLKTQLIHILKHPKGAEHHDTIVAILHDLGMSNSDLNKAIPNREEMRRMAKKRAAKLKKEESEEQSAARKRARLQTSNIPGVSDLPLPPMINIKSEPSAETSKPRSPTPPGLGLPLEVKEELMEIERSKQKEQRSEAASPKDPVVQWLQSSFDIAPVVELVMDTMLLLPPTMPAIFNEEYKPVEAAGTPQQKAKVAQLLADQLLEVIPIDELLKQINPSEETSNNQSTAGGADSDDESPLIFLGSKRAIYTAPPPVLPPPPLAPVRAKIDAVNLSQLTPVLTGRQQDTLQLLLSKKLLQPSIVPSIRNNTSVVQFKEKIMASMLTMATDEEVRAVEGVVLAEPATYSRLLESWLFNLHAAASDFTSLSKLTSSLDDDPVASAARSDYQSYKLVLLRVIKAMLFNVRQPEILQQSLSSLLMSLPSLPLEVISVLVETAVGSSAANVDVSMISVLAPLLRDLALWRSTIANHTVAMLCSLATHEIDEVRDAVLSELEAILISGGDLADVIIAAGKTHLKYLTEQQPPEILFAEHLGRPEEQKQWEESTVKACLNLPLAILPTHQSLVHDLAGVYVGTVNEAKRGILRLLDAPVSLMGMDSPELLTLVRNTPKGSETLITRIIHVLTEKAPPSEALVCQVRELYNRRVSDVRFLIPVLTGLSKKEVIAVLPKLIKLNPQVVQEVFNRLWGITLDSGSSPLSPVELMVALHLIEPDKCDLKTVMRATNMCFQERKIYTAEVLGVVLQQLMEEANIPTLLMRTVIMALTHHPKLLSFIINVLVRLIDRDIWEQQTVWEGFTKCCVRALPQSVAVLLQLPHEPLRKALTGSKELFNALLSHIQSLTPQQKAHIPAEIFAIVGLPNEGQTEENNTGSSEAAPVREITSPIQHAA